MKHSSIVFLTLSYLWHGVSAETVVQLVVPDSVTWAWDIIRATGYFLLRMCQLPFLPVVWATVWLWQRLVVLPLTLAMEATSLMYPVLLYCGAAIVCGVAIGGCGGFALEAMTSTLLNMTWGKPPKGSEVDPTQELADDHEDDDGNAPTARRFLHRPSMETPTSSFYRFSTEPSTSR
ncbi:hypothetical protein DM01DRAFT_1333503, partial [Hesseltinella vesiculosa]